MIIQIESAVALERSNTEHDTAIIIDDNMYYESMRQPLFQIARKCLSLLPNARYPLLDACGVLTVFLRCSVDSALLRNAARHPEGVPAHIIQTMHSRLEPPTVCPDPARGGFLWVVDTTSAYPPPLDMALLRRVLETPLLDFARMAAAQAVCCTGELDPLTSNRESAAMCGHVCFIMIGAQPGGVRTVHAPSAGLAHAAGRRDHHVGTGECGCQGRRPRYYRADWNCARKTPP